LLAGLMAVGLVVLVGIAAGLGVPLQPPLHGSSGPVAGGTVVMPAGVGGNTKLNFNPPVVTVIIGKNNTVTWDNQDSFTHTVTSTDGSFNSGDIKAGATWTYTFGSAGNYSYYCIYHSAWMKGTVIVLSS
ncbi:MAG TPA: cupredoxin domain-containing protein, partial [Nitrososphaerales archaeon]|nr:cupredoxin domain-containing protein [Nitrososphaerales archaeon]